MFQREPAEVEAQLAADLVGSQATCSRLNLEELFIEAVEGQVE